ncbi:hypothetical protein DM860_011268 [Cuscuta australis]|uniref:Uncharacterized protein n=1 Tax=Cuscuta australis TaxID=267555 RepID=A0A328DQI4_9ASTE|nr:hypothetical protein DM860_011268 [Cuscuta australis]
MITTRSGNHSRGRCRFCTCSLGDRRTRLRSSAVTRLPIFSGITLRIAIWMIFSRARSSALSGSYSLGTRTWWCTILSVLSFEVH